MFRFVLLALIGVSCAHATSIVIKLNEQRIVIAADNLGIDAAGVVHEDQCKIVQAGGAAFAAMGISSFSPSHYPTLGATANWDAKDEERNAYAVHNNDVEAAASGASGLRRQSDTLLVCHPRNDCEPVH